MKSLIQKSMTTLTTTSLLLGSTFFLTINPSNASNTNPENNTLISTSQSEDTEQSLDNPQSEDTAQSLDVNENNIENSQSGESLVNENNNENGNNNLNGESLDITPDAITTGTWGDAPWSFDNTTGVLTITGGTKASPKTLGEYSTSPWNSGTISNTAIKKIILSAPTGIKFPANSSFLFSSNTGNIAKSLTNLTTIENIGKINTSNVTNMYCMFQFVTTLTSLDISGWNTSNVTNMGFLFNGMTRLTSLDVSKWNTSKVTNINQTFYGLKAITTLDVSNWDVSNVTTMSWLFTNDINLTTLDVSKWNTNNVTGSMNGVFSGMSNLTYLNLSSWNTTRTGSKTNFFQNNNKLSTLILGPNSKFNDTTGIPAASTSANGKIYTGKWVQTLPPAPADKAWWSGTSTELMNRSNAPAPGTYVWQESAPVIFEPNGGTWSGRTPAWVTNASNAGIGDKITISSSPKPSDYKYAFKNWLANGANANGEVSNGYSFILTNPGETTITAQWKTLTVIPIPKPYYSEPCNQPRKLVLPNPTMIKYTIIGNPEAVGTAITVKWEAEEGYVFAPGQTASWSTIVPNLNPILCAYPEKPTLEKAPSCGIESTVKIPENIPNITYTKTQVGTLITVTATAINGYIIPSGWTAEWTFDIAADPCPPPVITLPNAGGFGGSGFILIGSMLAVVLISGSTFIKLKKKSKHLTKL